MNTVEIRLLGAGTILLLTTVSCFGIRGGKLVQNLVAVAKVSGLAAIIFLLSAKGSRPVHPFEAPVHFHGAASSFTRFGIALVAVLWAYEGWHVVSFVAGEMKRPKLDLPRSLLCGTAIVMLIFLAANIGYYHTLSAAEIRTSDAVAASAVRKLLGPIAANSLSFLILASILGSMNGLILTGPRVYYAMAGDGIFPRVFGQLSDRYRTPIVALIVQGVWAAMLAASGSYEQLFTDVIFTAWIFYGLAVAAVLVLRRKQPQMRPSFCVPGYPWLPLSFCVAAACLILSTLIARPAGASIGIGLVASGIPVYLFVHKGRSARGETPDLA